MSEPTITIEQIRAICRQREIDLVVTVPPRSFVLSLHGEFDGYGDYFSILVADLEYVDLTGNLTVGDLYLTHEIEEVSRLNPKWAHIAANYSGRALVLRSANADSWQSAQPQDLFLVIANTFSFRAGTTTLEEA